MNSASPKLQQLMDSTRLLHGQVMERGWLRHLHPHWPLWPREYAEIALLGLAALAGARKALLPPLRQGEDPALPNFHRVNETLYRGAQPTAEGIAQLRRLGVRTVINLRKPEEALAERPLVEQQGMNFVSEPLPFFNPPGLEAMRRIQSVLLDPVRQPVFVHCRRGTERTGEVIAVYRVSVEGWSTARALREARSCGLRWWQIRMRRYIGKFLLNPGEALAALEAEKETV